MANDYSEYTETMRRVLNEPNWNFEEAYAEEAERYPDVPDAYKGIEWKYLFSDTYKEYLAQKALIITLDLRIAYLEKTLKNNVAFKPVSRQKKTKPTAEGK